VRSITRIKDIYLEDLKKMNMNRIILAAFMVCTSLMIFSCKDTQSVDTKTTVEASAAAPSMNVSAQSNKKGIKVKSGDQASSGDEMQWYGMGEVEALVKENPKKIIVDVYTQWCGPCKMMDRNTFSDAAVQKAINDKFYPVKFDAEGAGEIAFKGKTYANPNHNPSKRGRNSPHQLSGFFSVRGYPTLVVLDENFNVLHKLVGYKTPDKLLAEIAAI